MEYTDDQVEVLKEIPGYVRRDVLYKQICDLAWTDEQISTIKGPSLNTDFARGWNTALEWLKSGLDAGVI